MRDAEFKICKADLLVLLLPRAIGVVSLDTCEKDREEREGRGKETGGETRVVRFDKKGNLGYRVGRVVSIRLMMFR